MKKFALLLFLSAPFFCYSQTVVETVKLRDGKQATLYDDGTWRYTSMPTSSSTSNVEGNKSTSTITPVRSSTAEKSSPSTTSSSYTSACGARTKAGGSCKRMVKGGGRCWQHQ